MRPNLLINKTIWQIIRLLPFHKTGRHRRILFADLMAYKQKRDQESLKAMQALAYQAQELELTDETFTPLEMLLKQGLPMTAKALEGYTFVF